MSKQQDTIKISKITLWQIIAFVFFVLFIISLLTGGFGISTETKSAQGSMKVGTSKSGDIATKVNLEGAQVLGDENAPVTIVEWSDFQCPFCARFYSQTEKKIVEEYVNTGKVKIIFKHFPLDQIHPFATVAALASECAGEQGKFREYHDILFNNYQAINAKNLNKWASDLGLDQSKFDSCLESQKYLSKIKSDMAEGAKAGVRGTPGFLVNGQLISGAQPYSVFKSAIEAALN